MGQLLRFELDGGGTVLVEVADDEPGIEQAARVGDLIVKARVSLENALGSRRPGFSEPSVTAGDR